jgi:transaldolase
MTVLDQLREMTVIVADTGDIDSIKKHRPRDATTNPSLLLSAAQMPGYQHLLKDAIDKSAVDIARPDADLRPVLEHLAVNFGREILSIIPGRVSVEVDAALSFDTLASINTALRLISLFEQQGIDRLRVLIKIAATWEGIKAAEELEKQGIHCNLTLLFGFAQAVACAEAHVTLISPFVGRILDWYKAKQGLDQVPGDRDPGVLSVKQIFNYYKKFGYATEIMGASFRNTDEIMELAGCDLLTISPKLIDELNREGLLTQKLKASQAVGSDLKKIVLDEKAFRWMLNEDAMATEKLAEGIRKFNMDNNLLGRYVRSISSSKE